MLTFNADPGTPAFAGLSILVVEDSDDALDMMKQDADSELEGRPSPMHPPVIAVYDAAAVVAAAGAALARRRESARRSSGVRG